MGWYRHPGIVSEATPLAERSVISSSWRHRSVAEEPFSEFAAGRNVRVDGYFGDLQPEHVLQRARAALGTPYDLFKRNCEHFVRYAHGVVPSSPQLKVAIGVTAMCLLATALVCRRR